MATLSRLQEQLLRTVHDMFCNGRPRVLNPFAAVKEYLRDIANGCASNFDLSRYKKLDAAKGRVRFEQVSQLLIVAEFAELASPHREDIGLAPGAGATIQVEDALKSLRAGGLITKEGGWEHFPETAYPRRDGAIVLLTVDPRAEMFDNPYFGGERSYQIGSANTEIRRSGRYLGSVYDVRVVERPTNLEAEFVLQVEQHVAAYLAKWRSAPWGESLLGSYSFDGLGMWETPDTTREVGGHPSEADIPAGFLAGSIGCKGRFSRSFMDHEVLPCYVLTDRGRLAIQEPALIPPQDPAKRGSNKPAVRSDIGKDRRNANHRLKSEAKRDLVVRYAREHITSFKTLKELSAQLLKNKGLEVSPPTLSRYLVGTEFSRKGNPRRAAPGKKETEAVSPEPILGNETLEFYVMPEDDDSIS